MSSTRNTPADKRTVAAARRWGFDLHTNAYRPGDGSSGLELAKTREELATKEVASVEPLGFLRDFDHLGVEEDDSSKKKQVSIEKLKLKRAMEIGYAPGKNLLMTGFMLWMSGANVNIFSMMITGMAVINPIKALFNVNGAYKALDDGKLDLTMAKLTYLAMNLLGLAMGLYKCATMGLLPLTSSDWVVLLGNRPALEYSGTAVPL
jgi:hypothetical protein